MNEYFGITPISLFGQTSLSAIGLRIGLSARYGAFSQDITKTQAQIASDFDISQSTACRLLAELEDVKELQREKRAPLHPRYKLRDPAPFERFGRVPARFIGQVPLAHLPLFAYLDGFHENEARQGGIYPKQETIAERMNTSRPNVSAMLKSWKAADGIVVIPQGYLNHYLLQWEERKPTRPTRSGGLAKYTTTCHICKKPIEEGKDWISRHSTQVEFSGTSKPIWIHDRCSVNGGKP